MTTAPDANPVTPPDSKPDAEGTKPYMRTIKSYVKRAGRMGGGQERAMAELGPKFLLPYQPVAINLESA
jgi:tRNA (guanine-N7-)-methyltransferase